MENAPTVTMSLLDAGLDSLFGDAYKKGEWRPLSAGTLLTEGWDEPWFNGPAGREGLTPRQGWLGSDSGLFYRLWHTNFTYAHQLGTPNHGDQYTGSYHIFLPFSRRLEIAVDAPFAVSNGTSDPRRGYTSNFGDLLVVPRFLVCQHRPRVPLRGRGEDLPARVCRGPADGPQGGRLSAQFSIMGGILMSPVLRHDGRALRNRPDQRPAQRESGVQEGIGGTPPAWSS